jgi:hypothetical protein
MRRVDDTQRVTLSFLLIAALIAAVVPACFMVGCDMDMGAMGFVPAGSVGFTSQCPGQWVTSSAPTGIVPTGLASLVFAFTVALFGAAVLFFPRGVSRLVLARANEPPPPPEDPRGERLRI